MSHHLCVAGSPSVGRVGGLAYKPIREKLVAGHWAGSQQRCRGEWQCKRAGGGGYRGSQGRLTQQMALKQMYKHWPQEAGLAPWLEGVAVGGRGKSLWGGGGWRANTPSVYLTRVGLPVWGLVAQYTNGHVTSSSPGNQAGRPQHPPNLICPSHDSWILKMSQCAIALQSNVYVNSVPVLLMFIFPLLGIVGLSFCGLNCPCHRANWYHVRIQWMALVFGIGEQRLDRVKWNVDSVSILCAMDIWTHPAFYTGPLSIVTTKESQTCTNIMLFVQKTVPSYKKLKLYKNQFSNLTCWLLIIISPRECTRFS